VAQVVPWPVASWAQLLVALWALLSVQASEAPVALLRLMLRKMIVTTTWVAQAQVLRVAQLRVA
jgi:hypothetical protein